MNTMELVHFVSTGEGAPRRSPRCKLPPTYDELIRPAREAIMLGRQLLLSEQRSDGSWNDHQTCDSSLASQFVLFLAYMGQEHSELAEQAASGILQQQLLGGGWSHFPGGPPEVNSSVLAYFALKLAALEPGDERLGRARVAIRQLGGADACDAITRFFLALLGQIDYDCCPVVPPEWLPRARRPGDCIDPLSLVWSHRAVRDVGIDRGVRELFIRPPREWPILDADACRATRPRATVSARNVRSFGRWIRALVLQRCERLGWTPLRRTALRRTESQLAAAFDTARASDFGFGELVWHAIAQRLIGHGDDSPQWKTCYERLRSLVQIADGGREARPQLRLTPLGNTLSAFEAILASGVALEHPCAAAAASWLGRLRRRHLRDRAMEPSQLLRLLRLVTNRTDAGANVLPPQIRIVGRRPVLCRNSEPTPMKLRRATEALIREMHNGQNRNGSWSWSEGDEGSPDVTAIVLESLARCDNDTSSCTVERAVQFLRRVQRADGSWDSATGVRWIHGTSVAVRGLLAVGVPIRDEAVAAGVNWLFVHQQADGGWGELPTTAADRECVEFVPGPSSAIQTAWAVSALTAAGRADDAAARRGVDHIIQTQAADGRWHERPSVWRDPRTGRWFHSDLRCVTEPLVALSKWAVAASAECASNCGRAPLRLVDAAADE
jgi:squalene-hopene/tetraprenyl-beta-curcumene cyclase